MTNPEGTILAVYTDESDSNCVSRYKYLGVYFCLSGSFTYAQEDLYNKSLKGYFKFSKEFLPLTPNIHISMHVFNHTIKPILLYGCEIWGSFNPFTSKLLIWNKFTPSYIQKKCINNFVNTYLEFINKPQIWQC